MAQAIKEHIRYNSKIVALDCNKGRVTTQNGDIFSARHIIFTIPWRSVEHFDNMPEGMRDKINRLKHTGVRIEYFAQNIASDAHWIYCPQPDLPFHRQLLIPNFFEGAAGHWTETNSVRSAQINADAVFENPYAYPLNTVDKPEIMSELLAWTARLKIYGLGRWGEHQHYNSDVTVERALQLCNSLMQENT
jgi:UDP-galactopyranose mutase